MAVVDATPVRHDVVEWEHRGPVSVDYVRVAESLFSDADLIVGFNLKYDLHWARRCGIITYGVLNKTLWDVQLAQFIIRHQQEKYPSLNSTCEYWGLPKKLDVVETEYWDKGLDTTDVPYDILCEYGKYDVELTYKCYLKQMEYLQDKPELARLIRIANMDLLVLAEMEWNGLRYDVAESAVRAKDIEREIAELDQSIKGIVGPYDFNFNSNDQLSCLLYGGTVKFSRAIPYEHTFKSGQRAGQTVTRYKHEETEVVFPRLVKPDDRRKLAKDGYWSTDASALSSIKTKNRTAASLIKTLLRRSELERLLSTYYVGFPKKIAEMDWAEGEIHSNLNQCVAVTGRLSSTNPNQQNIPPEVYELVKTRFV